MYISTQGAWKYRKSSKSWSRKISSLQSFLFEKAKILVIDSAPIKTLNKRNFSTNAKTYRKRTDNPFGANRIQL